MKSSYSNLKNHPAGEASNSKSKQSPTYSSSSSTNSSAPSSPFFHRFKQHDQEEDHGQNQKKSVLTKVKEKAKKLRHSLSKKKHEDGSLTSPPSAAGLESDGVEEDAEYHGAPMYESEKAPAGYKETTTQQNPRGNPGTPEKHVISTNDKHIVEQDHEKSLNRSLSKRTTQQAKTPTAAAAATAVTILSDPNKTTNKTIAEKLTPVHAEGSSDASNSMTSKFQGLTVSKPTDHHNHYHASSSTVTPTKTSNNSLSFAAPRTPPANAPSQASSSTNQSSSLAPVTPAPSGKNTSPTAQIWDKGVSMKEYLMNKLEPGEDEKALSQVISEAMSPKRTPGDAGVMEKVREAVTSLLRNEEPAPATRMLSQIPASTNAATATRASSQVPVFSNAQEVSHHAATRARASSQIPVSSNAQEVVQGENRGRILQAN